MVDYYSEDNPPIYEKIAPFRFVRPYEHCYKTRAKGRWVKRRLIEALEQEFKAYDREYYATAIKNGKLLLNDKKVTEDYIIQYLVSLILGMETQSFTILCVMNPQYSIFRSK